MTKKSIAAAIGVVVFVVLCGYSITQAAVPVVNGMEVVDTVKLGSGIIYKVIDHEASTTCYVINASGISCVPTHE